MLEEGQSKYLRDFKLNFNGILTSDHLSPKEVALMGLCIAVNNNNAPLTSFFKQLALKEGATQEEIAEAVSVASLLSANNVLYRFRHFTQKEAYQKMSAKMRMQIMMKPVTGKPFFELMSLAVSAVNGCEQCVNSHEDSLIKLDVKEEKIWDAVRIATVVTATGKVIY
jgi:lipoyl-dependent peroxiredoxin subunit D